MAGHAGGLRDGAAAQLAMGMLWQVQPAVWPYCVEQLKKQGRKKGGTVPHRPMAPTPCWALQVCFPALFTEVPRAVSPLCSLPAPARQTR